MTIKLNETVAVITDDNLFYANDPAANTDGIVIASGQGKLVRGTVLAKTVSGNFVILGTTKTAGYYKASSTDAGALKVVASGAVTGEINLASVTPVIGTYTAAAGDYVLYQKADAYAADCILCDGIDATSAAVDTVAYRTGHFNANALTVKSGYTLSDTDKDVLRTKGILLSTSN